MTVESSVSPAAALSPLAMQTKEEILTQLHLIKDIRRLETYQRDFFLKVKESLHQVQQLLDHQLMDVAWSDQLLCSEETLLKASVRLSNASPAQVSELYGLVVLDKEKLSQRFNELSVKSSLSEFVVNSRQPLDVDTVHRATEAILRNDKPKQPIGDKSIPFDHTFFLANFCMTTIASSTFAASPKAAAANSNKETVQQQYYNSVMDNALNKQAQRSMVAPNAAVASTFYNANNTNNNAHNVADPTANVGNVGNEQLMEKFASSRKEMVQPSSVVAAVTNAPGSALIGHELASAISQIAGQQQASGIMNNAKNVANGTALKTAKPNQTVLSNGFSSNPSALYAQPRGKGGASTLNGPQQSIAVTQDPSSDPVVLESSETVEALDSGKPLSFARIASLHLNDHHLTNGLTNKALVAPGHRLQEPQQPQSTTGGAPTANLNLSADLALSNREARYFFDLMLESKPLGRVIIAVHVEAAPRMARNFALLATNERGFGYRGCTFFQAWKGESVITGDWEHNSGRGGRAALETGPLFTPDDTKLPCVRGAVGMRRMSKKHSSLNQVASQFRIILANMNSQFTGIFGHVIFGLDALDKVADIGGEGGRPERTATIVQCGLYKN